jgi:ABC-2 type transport system permease protein
MMTLTIARKELTELVRDGRFRLTAGIVLALILGALWTGWKNYSDVSRDQQLAQKETRQDWLTQGVKNPHSAAHYGVYAFKPKLPLSFIDQGTDPYTGVAVWLEAHKQDDFQYRPAQDANSLQRFGNLSAAAVLQILVPLLITLLTFSAFAGERETGTMRQLLSLGVRRDVLGYGKAMGIAAALALLLVPAALAGSALLVFTETSDSASTLGRIAVLAGSYLLYFGAFTALALAISARARTSRIALLCVLALWIVNCLIAPRAAVDLAKRIDPTPSSFTFTQDLQRDLAHDGDMDQFKRDVLKKYGVDSVEKLPVSYRGLSLAKGEENGAIVFDRHYNDLWDRFERQNRTQQRTSIAAPLLAVRSLSMALAGTDFDQHRHFATAAESYRRFFISRINEDITANDVKLSSVYTRGNDLWAKIPEFHYEAPDLAHVLGQQVWSLAILVLWCAGAIAFAVFSVRRIQPE